MDNNFDWQTEEEVDWDDLPHSTPDQAERTHRRAWPRRFWWLLLVGLLLAGGWLALQQVTARVAEVEADATADLLASHELLLRAAAEQDEDVALALLSGRDAAWTVAQTELVEAGLWLERPSLGLTYLETADEGITVTLSSDLFTADMVYNLLYQTEAAESIILQQTAVYRRGADRWLYAPPDSDYWGGWEEQEYPRLTLRYRQQDADLGRRLGRDLSQAVADLCLRIEGMNCPADFQVRVQLDPQPDSLLLLNTAVLPHHELAYHYRLPTPSLIGRPLDEASYQALSRGYAAWLLGGIVADQTDYTCCPQVAVFQALLHYQLSQIGLTAWPVDEAVYQQVVAVERVPDGRILSNFWWADTVDGLATEDRWMAYLLVDYLLAETAGQSPAAWQKMLGVRQELYAWLETVELGSSGDSYTALANEVWWYAYLQSLAQTDTDLPLSLPAQDLMLSCATDASDIPRNRLLHYSPLTNRWQVAGSYTGFPMLYRAPDRDGVLFMEWEQQTALDGVRINWWRDGAVQSLSSPEKLLSTWGQLSPDGRFLRVNQFELEEQILYPGLLNLTDCSQSGCRFSPLEGSIIWSPGGQRSLILTDFDDTDPRYTSYTLRLADSQGLAMRNTERITGVRSPFWVDEETFGYVTRSDTGRQRVIIVAAGEAQLLFEPAAFEAITYVAANPYRADHYLLQLETDSGRRQLIDYDAAARIIRPILAGGPDGFFPPPIMVGHYLLLRYALIGSNSGISRLLIYDMRDGSEYTYYLRTTRYREPYISLNDAAAGEWLALLLDDRHLLLTVPHLGYHQLMVHRDLQNCYGLAWIATAD
jgi:hypothetical protein